MGNRQTNIRGIAMLILTSLVMQLNAQNQDYETLKTNISKRQNELQQLYDNKPMKRDSLVHVAQSYLFKTMVLKMFPAWYGTKWDFNGITTEPRVGYIACGYFVTTTLRDMGFDIPRVRWAQLPSESMIKNMTLSKYILRYRNSQLTSIESRIKASGDGLYVVGLDNHTGFILNVGGVLRFIHSYYFNKKEGVMSEPFDTDGPLKWSRYKVLGKILTEEMTLKWLKGERFP